MTKPFTTAGRGLMLTLTVLSLSAMTLGCQVECNTNMVQYTVNEGAVIRTDELGVLVGTDQKTHYLYDGGSETATFELYNYDDHICPESMVLKRPNGDVVSIFLDYSSKHYEEMHESLQNRITFFNSVENE